MARLMTASLVAAFALSACASFQGDRNTAQMGSPDWRDLSSPATPSAATGGSLPSPEMESPELDEGKF